MGWASHREGPAKALGYEGPLQDTASLLGQAGEPGEDWGELQAGLLSRPLASSSASGRLLLEPLLLQTELEMWIFMRKFSIFKWWELILIKNKKYHGVKPSMASAGFGPRAKSFDPPWRW